MKSTYYVAIACVLFGAGCATASVTTPAVPTTSQTPTVGASSNMSRQGLTKIPMDVFSQRDLKNLDLSYNALTGAPQSQIGQLSALVTLDLSHNQLTGLPAELGRLNKLEVLNVSHNQLTGLPMELGNLTQLRILDISGNNYSTQDLDAIAKKLPNTEIRK